MGTEQELTLSTGASLHSRIRAPSEMDSVTLSWDGLVLKNLNAVVMANSPAVLDELSLISFQFRLCYLRIVKRGSRGISSNLHRSVSVNTGESS